VLFQKISIPSHSGFCDLHPFHPSRNLNWASHFPQSFGFWDGLRPLPSEFPMTFHGGWVWIFSGSAQSLEKSEKLISISLFIAISYSCDQKELTWLETKQHPGKWRLSITNKKAPNKLTTNKHCLMSFTETAKALWT